MKLVVISALCLALSACDSPLAEMPDHELADAMYACTVSNEQTPGFAIRCDNLRRECGRRRDGGRYVC